MSSNDYKEFKKIIKDPKFKKQTSTLVECSAKILSKKVKKLISFGTAKLLEMMGESDSESEDAVPYPEVERDELLEWQESK
jgi:hypothetical protein